jgi:hypothetical protein
MILTSMFLKIRNLVHALRHGFVPWQQQHGPSPIQGADSAAPTTLINDWQMQAVLVWPCSHLNGQGVNDALLICGRQCREDRHVEDCKIQYREKVRKCLHHEAFACVGIVEIAGARVVLPASECVKLGIDTYFQSTATKADAVRRCPH